MAKKDQDMLQRALGDVQEDSSDVAEALSDLMEHLGDEKDIEMFTDLSQREINHLAVLGSTGDALMDEFTEEYMKLKVSSKRRGRKELIDVSNAFAKLHEMSEGNGLAEKIKGTIL